MTTDPADAARVLLASAGGEPHEEDLVEAQVALAAALAAQGLVPVGAPPAEVVVRVGIRGGDGDVRPRVALVPSLEPGPEWKRAAERYAVCDQAAGAALIARGVPVERITVTGWPVGPAWLEAAAGDRQALRARYQLDAEAVIAVVDTRGLDEGALAGVLLQLSLVDEVEPLFDAPDEEAAEVLRARAPRFGLRARRFGAVPEVPLLYRAADLAIGRIRPALVARARLLGLALLALPAGDDDLEALALAERGIGRAASSFAGLAAALQRLRAADELAAARAAAASSARPDAAAAVARLVADVARRREAIREEPEPVPAPPPAAGPLEEIGVSPEEQARLRDARRSERLAEEREREEIDARLAALKARLKDDR